MKIEVSEVEVLEDNKTLKDLKQKLINNMYEDLDNSKVDYDKANLLDIILNHEE